MNRTRAQALALVNWNGVFYERYLLDRHVTALEGTNGAGKTTVMIAAYVVLLPDMSRLRFTNVGESGATGGDKGIWGRLGEPGRPSYAVIDFALADRGRLIAGVHLERKSEPSVEPTPFIILGLADDVRTQDLLLVSQGDSEVVPELSELRENAARLGGRLQVFSSARDYFAALFDQGVTPLRLSTDEERSKLNEMLRASMTGGISKALTSELRAFLLKEESGLADTLQRMRANLDACRRTRIEVQESRRLEREIGGVFEAGQIMFAAAFLSTRERAGELERRVAEAETALVQSLETQAAAETALARTTSELELVDKRRQQIQKKQESAREWHTRVSDALTAANALAARAEEVNAASQEAARAKDVRDRAERLRNRKREELHRAQDNYERAAGGLADIQQGIQELHRRAGAYHQVVRRLREAEDALDVPAVSVDALEENISRAEADLHAVDRERRQASTRLADADDHQQRHSEVLAALRSLTGAEVALENSLSTAVEALRRHRDQTALAKHVASIAANLQETRRMAERQAAVRDPARELGITISTEPAGLVIQSVLGKLEAERSDHEEKERSARTNIATAGRTTSELETQRRGLTAREPEWREYSECATRLSAHMGSAVDDRSSLDRARAIVNDSLSSAQSAEDSARGQGDTLAREARELIAAGGPFSTDLLRMKDELNADLLATGFEDVALGDAGLMEAHLGPLAQALVVDDPRSAARTIGGRPEALCHVLLVPRCKHPGDKLRGPTDRTWIDRCRC